MENKFEPVSVDVQNSKQLLTIEWGDGHRTELGLFGLRKNCPCVSCRGGHDKMGRFEPELFRIEPVRKYQIISAEAIGNHALKITWDDGHNSGMYRWDLLRHMDEAVRELDDKK